MLAALGSLTLRKQFLENVLPKDQGFQDDYAGIFHFRVCILCCIGTAQAWLVGINRGPVLDIPECFGSSALTPSSKLCRKSQIF